MGVECMSFVDLLCQTLDMVHPKTLERVSFVFRPTYVLHLSFGRLADLKRCKQTKVFFNTFLNVKKVRHAHVNIDAFLIFRQFLEYEERDQFQIQKERELNGGILVRTSVCSDPGLISHPPSHLTGIALPLLSIPFLRPRTTRTTMLAMGIGRPYRKRTWKWFTCPRE